MFTLKLYGAQGTARRIVEAHEFHINMAQAGGYEITAYVRPDCNEVTRYDVGDTGTVDPDGGRWDYAYIENSAGKTTEKLFPVPGLVRQGDHKPPMALGEIAAAEAA